jgi:hypothetical protein
MTTACISALIPDREVKFSSAIISRQTGYRVHTAYERMGTEGSYLRNEATRTDKSLQSSTEMQDTLSNHGRAHRGLDPPFLHDMTVWYPHERADHSLQSSTEMQAAHS